MMIYLLEVDAINNAGDKVTLRFGTDYYQTLPSDTPANTEYLGLIEDAGAINKSMFDNRTTAGASKVSKGNIVLTNLDGQLDYIKGYGFDGQKVVQKYGDSSKAYSTFTTIFTGTLAGIEADLKKITLIARDPLELLSQPLITAKYLGDNVPPDGVEGGDNLKDKTKPRTYGVVFNATPQLVNHSKLIYQFSDKAIVSVSALYDGGATLTAEANYTDLAQLNSTAPSAGCFRVLPALGLVRLGSAPTFDITGDVIQGASNAAMTVAQVLKLIALDAGVASGDIVAADVSALDALNNSVVGLSISTGDAMTALAAMDAIANSIGAWFGFDQLGRLRMGRLSAPSGTPFLSLDAVDIIAIERISSNDDKKGIPAHTVTLNYAKNYTLQTSNIAGSVTLERKDDLKIEYRKVSAADVSVKAKHKLAQELKRDTLLIDKAAAEAEAARLLAIYKLEQETYKVDIDIDLDKIALDVGHIVSVAFHRYGLDAGVLFLVLGLEPDHHKKRNALTLWRVYA